MVSKGRKPARVGNLSGSKVSASRAGRVNGGAAVPSAQGLITGLGFPRSDASSKDANSSAISNSSDINALWKR